MFGSSKPTHGEVYSLHYMIKFVSNLWFSPVSSTNKANHHITKILLKVGLNTMTLTLQNVFRLQDKTFIVLAIAWTFRTETGLALMLVFLVLPSAKITPIFMFIISKYRPMATTIFWTFFQGNSIMFILRSTILIWSDCWSVPTQQFFSYIMARTMKWWWGPLCTRPTRLAGFLYY